MNIQSIEIQNIRPADKNFFMAAHSCLPWADKEKLMDYFYTKDVDINMVVDNVGNTFLHVACANDDINLVIYLLEKGADPDVFNSSNRLAFDLLEYSIHPFYKNYYETKIRKLEMRILELETENQVKIIKKKVSKI